MEAKWIVSTEVISPQGAKGWDIYRWQHKIVADCMVRENSFQWNHFQEFSRILLVDFL